MGHINQFLLTFDFQSTDPRIKFFPRPANQTGSVLSGNPNGAMASTNTIYSQIVEKSRQQLFYLTVAWTGTPTGTFQVLGSADGINFNALTFNPALAQPAGSPGGYGIDVQTSAKYILLEYMNSSGSGTLNVTGQFQNQN